MADYHYGDSPIDIQDYLEGIDFPASREELIEQARENNAPREILEYLAKLPDQEYTGLVDVAPDLFEAEF